MMKKSGFLSDEGIQLSGFALPKSGLACAKLNEEKASSFERKHENQGFGFF